jgi:hypothetical protein
LGFVPGRFIGENTCLLYEFIQNAEENNLPVLCCMFNRGATNTNILVLGLTTDAILMNFYKMIKLFMVSNRKWFNINRHM